MKKILSFFGSRQAFYLWIMSLSAYVLLERTGLFRFDPAPYREIFHSLSFRILSMPLFLSALTGIVAHFRSERSGRSRGVPLFCLSVMILVVGLWVSYFTHFSGKVIKAEGQPFGAFPLEYVQPTIYKAKYAKLPQIGINPKKFHLTTSPDSRKMRKVTVDIDYSGRTTGGILSGRLSSRRPLISDWTMIWISDFGYAPKYELLDDKENPLEWNYTFLKLFPPDTEDYLKTQFLGYLFYLKLYPDYEDKDGKPATKSAELKNPVFNLRVVRNKDIIYSDLMKLSEKLKFDDVVISFPEVRPWIEMTLVRDLGLPVIAAGLVLLIASLPPMVLGTKRR